MTHNSSRKHSPQRGRPQEVNPELLYEAAIELFQIRGYNKTPVEEIARVAGYSRATYFNTFATKSDVLWYPIDVMLKDISKAHQNGDLTTISQLHDMISANFDTLGPPWVFSNFWLLGNETELFAAATKRVLLLHSIVKSIPINNGPMSFRQSMDHVSAIISSIQEWIADGVHRKHFSIYLNI